MECFPELATVDLVLFERGFIVEQAIEEKLFLEIFAVCSDSALRWYYCPWFTLSA